MPPGGGALDSNDPLYGRTNNPYDLARTPGESSGGETAIIAAAGSPLGIGSDSGGSIRLPAHNRGIAGIRPTVGRAPATGAGHAGDMNDQRTRVGLLARAVADRALTLPLIAGMDWRDASVVPLPIRDPSADTIQGLRVAFYTEDGISTPTPATVAGVRAAAQALAQAGARVEEQAPPGIERCWDITQGVWRRHRGETTAPAYARALAHWSRLRSCMLAFMEQRDVIVCPVSACPAALHGASENYNLATIISYTVAYSLTGWPAVTVRAGTSPEGVQVVARPWREDVALAAEQCIEAALGGWQRPPL